MLKIKTFRSIHELDNHFTITIAIYYTIIDAPSQKHINLYMFIRIFNICPGFIITLPVYTALNIPIQSYLKLGTYFFMTSKPLTPHLSSISRKYFVWLLFFSLSSTFYPTYLPCKFLTTIPLLWREYLWTFFSRLAVLQ